MASGAYVAGRDAQITQSAQDHAMLMDTSSEADALGIRMSERIAVDASHQAQIDELRRQHQEVIGAVQRATDRVDQLLQILWKDELRRQGRQ